MKWSWLSIVVIVPLLTGCGFLATASVNPTRVPPKALSDAVSLPGHVVIQSNPVSYVPPQLTLPTQVMDHLAAYRGRVTSVFAPPIAVRTHTEDLLYINPASGYAIAQFARIWRALAVKPAVVWTDTNTSIAVQEWTTEGYKTDPLPSPQTFYTQTDVLEPAAYVYHAGGWLELAGILRPQQGHDWVLFFDDSKH